MKKKWPKWWLIANIVFLFCSIFFEIYSIVNDDWPQATFFLICTLAVGRQIKENDEE